MGRNEFDVEQTPECDSDDEGEPEQGTSREQCSSEIGLTEDDLPDIIDSDIVDTASDVYDLEEYDSDTETEWDEWASGANDFTEIEDSVSLNGALKKLRRTLKLLKKSNIQHDLFEGLCKEIGLSGHIPHDMKVRWNSTYVMISSMLHRKSALQKFYDVNVRNAKIRELELTEQDWSLLECATSCLSPFEEATELASGSTYTTSSKAYMLIKGLVSFCEARSKRLLENRLKDQLLMQLKKYFVQNPRFKLELYQRAAYLDPCTYERMTLEERVAARQSLICLLSPPKGRPT